MAELIPISFDSYLGYASTDNVEAQMGGVNKDSAVNARVQGIGKRLSPHTENPKLPYLFRPLNTQQVNAFALPGGPVYVTGGLLNIVDNDDQLASVMGHELGHANARHGVKSMELALGANFVTDIIKSQLKKSDKLNLDAGDINRIDKYNKTLAGFISLGYSRENEYEADAKGLKYAHAADYNPYAMVEFMKKLQDMEGRKITNLEEFFSTHPSTTKRISEMNGIIAKYYPDAKPMTPVSQPDRLTVSQSARQYAGQVMDKVKELWQKPAIKWTAIGVGTLGLGFTAYRLLKPQITQIKRNPDIIAEKGQYYYPLNMWAIKRSSWNDAKEFALKNGLKYYWRWRGVGYFVSSTPPPETSQIIMPAELNTSNPLAEEPHNMTKKEYIEYINPKPSRMELMTRYFDETGKKIDTEKDILNVKKMYPREWEIMERGEKIRKKFYLMAPKDIREAGMIGTNTLDLMHDRFVEWALLAGKPVPARVMADYPHWQKWAEERNLIKKNPESKGRLLWRASPGSIPEIIEADISLQNAKRAVPPLLTDEMGRLYPPERHTYGEWTWAGPKEGRLQFIILQKPPQLAIEPIYKRRNPVPEFISSNEAIAYGRSVAGNTWKIMLLRQSRWQILDEISKIKKLSEPDYNELSKLTAQAQFIREAIESAEIKSNPGYKV